MNENKSNAVEREPAPVPFAVYEAALSCAQENAKRLWITILALIAAIVVIVSIGVYAWLQYDYTSDTVTVESSAGHANFIGANGDIYNGKDSLQEAQANPEG